MARGRSVKDDAREPRVLVVLLKGGVRQGVTAVRVRASLHTVPQHACTHLQELNDPGDGNGLVNARGRRVQQLTQFEVPQLV